jgi:alpha-glucosidase
MKFRCRLIPYLYDLLWKSHSRFEPMIRPTYFDFPDDARCFDENDDMLLGANLLVAPVVEPGRRDRDVYLPAGGGWYDFWSGEYFDGGRDVTLPAPWDRPPLLARAGSAIPLNLAEQHFNKPADERGFAVFPHRDIGEFHAECFEDDGESEGYRAGRYGLWELTVSSRADGLRLGIAKRGACPPESDRLTLLLPRQESRSLVVTGGKILSDDDREHWRTIVVSV